MGGGESLGGPAEHRCRAVQGRYLRHETYALLEEAGREGRLNFIGNIEANTALLGGADVIVADGYSGNILLKNRGGRR